MMVWDVLAKVDKFGEDNDSSDEEEESEEEEESKKENKKNEFEGDENWKELTAKEQGKFKNRPIDFQIRSERI